MSSIFIDRRENPKDKNFSNRQRFIDRSKQAIYKAAKKALGSKYLDETGDTTVTIPTDGITEHRFQYDDSYGKYDYVLPGNEDFIVGDKIEKAGEGSGGSGDQAGEGRGGQDEFEFALNYQEFLDVIFDDLELPDLTKESEKHAVAFKTQRAGHTTSGLPANLNVERTAIAGLSRRIALRSPKRHKIEELEKKIVDINEILEVSVFDGAWSKQLRDQLIEIEAEIKRLRAKASAISFLDDVDLRYNNFIKYPKPITQAAMFCLLDVSYSMGEREKIIAKKFFLLLYLFLQRRYQNIDVVFVRHHEEAEECDEETFFTSREGGGTVVSSGYKKIEEIIAKKYPDQDWNIYMAQASDGDNFGHDNQIVYQTLSENLLPILQHFIYIEIAHPGEAWGMLFGERGPSELWRTIQPLENEFENISCASLNDEKQVIQVFRNLFKKAIA